MTCTLLGWAEDLIIARIGSYGFRRGLFSFADAEMADYTPAQLGVLHLHLHCPEPRQPVLYLRTVAGDWRKYKSTSGHVTTGTEQGPESDAVIEALERDDAISNHAGIVWGEKEIEQ